MKIIIKIYLGHFYLIDEQSLKHLRITYNENNSLLAIINILHEYISIVF